MISDVKELTSLFELVSIGAELQPRYNIAPTQPVPVVRQATGGGRHLELLRWGLIPSWATDASIGNRMINARAETVHEKRAFRRAFLARRCLIVASGYYEWKRSPAGKQPYFIRLCSGGPMALAGIWERWAPSRGPAVDSCAIITTASDALLAQIHDRMPARIAPPDFGRWLSPNAEDVSELQALIAPGSGQDLEALPVSRHVNSPANDDARCIAPIGPALA